MNKRTPIFLGILLVLFALWTTFTTEKTIRQLIARLDDLVYDVELRTRVLTYHNVPLAPIAIIDIDDRSLKTEGRWPWSRGKLANLTDNLRQLGAAQIVFDVLFPEQENNIADLVLQNLTQKKWLTPALQAILQK